MNMKHKKFRNKNPYRGKPKRDDDDMKIKLASPQNAPAGSADVAIGISRKVFEEVWAYAGSDTSKELGGIILGSRAADSERPGAQKVLVQGYVTAKHTEALRGSVTFTHQSWDGMHQEREEKYPRLSIVGWFHTHPGFGIFLSSYDLFIHQNFFDLPWQIAYVLDPLNRQEGFFCWRNGQIEPCDFQILEA